MKNIEEKIVISGEDAGIRLDKFLVERLYGSGEDFSRGEIIRFIKDKKVLVNKTQSKPGYVLRENDFISFSVSKAPEEIISNIEVQADVLEENEDFIVVNKGAGMCVHPSRVTEKDTLINGIVARYPEIVGIGDGSPKSYLRPGMVHRLDKDTSGVMLVAKNQKAFDELKRKFQDREVSKTYQAIVIGKVEQDHFVVDSPIARATSYKKQIIAGKKTKTKVRSAVTEFSVLERLGKYSLIEARPKTGRMHQIRLHLLSVGHPIVGDKVYAKKEFLNNDEYLTADRQLLHAGKIEFELFGKQYKFSSEPPKDFKDFLEKIQAEN